MSDLYGQLRDAEDRFLEPPAETGHSHECTHCNRDFRCECDDEDAVEGDCGGCPRETPEKDVPTRRYEMKVICAWCGKPQPSKPVDHYLDHGKESHTKCDDCIARELGKAVLGE